MIEKLNFFRSSHDCFLTCMAYKIIKAIMHVFVCVRTGKMYLFCCFSLCFLINVLGVSAKSHLSEIFHVAGNRTIKKNDVGRRPSSLH